MTLQEIQNTQEILNHASLALENYRKSKILLDGIAADATKPKNDRSRLTLCKIVFMSGSASSSMDTVQTEIWVEAADLAPHLKIYVSMREQEAKERLRRL